MARLSRVSPIGVPEHIIQRGNNRQVCFAGEKDMRAYLGWLKEYSKKHSVEVHAWVLMTNHVHLLCTPKTNRDRPRLIPTKPKIIGVRVK